MCHIMLLMPVLALPLFWVLPPSQSIPIYVLLTVASGLLYWRISSSHKRPLQAGKESLIGTEAKVISSLKPASEAQYLVRSAGELWGAMSRDVLQPGDTVSITSVEGIRLVVTSASPRAEDALHPMRRGGMSQRT